MKTLIAIPCMDQLPALFAQSLSTLQKEDETIISFQIGSLVYTSRNELVKTAIATESDYIFWLDSDMVFKPSTLIDMTKELEEKNLDLLSGLYFRRVAPYSPVLFKSLTRTDSGVEYETFDKIPNKTFEIAGCGFGCVLMRTSMAVDVALNYKEMFDPFRGAGEDVAFCIRAGELGYKLWCNPNISLGHVGSVVITQKHWETLGGKQ